LEKMGTSSGGGIVGASDGAVWLLGVEPCSADGLEVAFTVVGTGLVLGVMVELGDGLVAVKGLELGVELIVGESIVWLLGIELCLADGLEVAFKVVVKKGLDTGLGAAVAALVGCELGVSLVSPVGGLLASSVGSWL
jgi:hypothetical protein